MFILILSFGFSSIIALVAAHYIIKLKEELEKARRSLMRDIADLTTQLMEVRSQVSTHEFLRSTNGRTIDELEQKILKDVYAHIDSVSKKSIPKPRAKRAK